MRYVPGREPSSEGLKYSPPGADASWNSGYGSITTSALGSVPNHFGISRLARSSAPRELARRMEAAGFDGVQWSTLSGGIAALHHGTRR